MNIIYASIGFYAAMAVAHVFMRKLDMYNDGFMKHCGGYCWRKSFWGHRFPKWLIREDRNSPFAEIEVNTNSCIAVGFGFRFGSGGHKISFNAHLFGAIYFTIRGDKLFPKIIPKCLWRRRYEVRITKTENPLGVLVVEVGQMDKYGEDKHIVYFDIFDFLAGKAEYSRSQGRVVPKQR